MTAPAVLAGVVAVMVVAFTNVTFVAGVPPNVTVGVAVNPVPVIVTVVPPAAGPLLAATLVTVGAATPFTLVVALLPDRMVGLVAPE